MKYTTSQQKAIDTLDKNLLITACAGSGKTEVISQRIIQIIKSGVQPSQIIAFTYTEKAAAELQGRVLKKCKEQIPDQLGIAEMSIGTIHGWCLKILQENVYKYVKYDILDQITQKLFINKNYKDSGMKELDLKRYEKTDDFIKIISALRESDTDELPAEYQKAIEMYEDLLHTNHYFDFSSIMTSLVEELQANDYQNELYKKLSQVKYLIVDEYQDVNPVQENIVKIFGRMDTNLCVVGDDDQNIFQWRGSDVDYIQHFHQNYPNVEYVKLEDNFRSSEGIIDVALKCITNNRKRLDKSMNKGGHQEYEAGDILYNDYGNVDAENIAIVNTIQNLRGTAFKDSRNSEERGLDYGDMCILVRKWKKADKITEALTEAGIPFIVSGVNELMKRPEVQASISIFQYLCEQIDKNLLKCVWNELSEKIKEEDLQEAIKYLESKVPNEDTNYVAFNMQEIYMTFLDKAGIREEMFVEGEKEHAGFRNEEIIFYNLGVFSKMLYDFEKIYFKSFALQKIQSFMYFLKYEGGQYSEGWLNNNLRVPNAVMIMSIFQSKGLEYPAVFVPGLNKNYLPALVPGFFKPLQERIQGLPIKSVERYISDDEAERRLLYVAITRAKKFLIMSRGKDGKQQGKESPFCAELRQSDYLLKSKTVDYSARPQCAPQYVNEISNISLNFSLLKAFFDCPYSFKFQTMYGFQSAFSVNMGYGSTIHRSLMEIHKEAIVNRSIAMEDIPELVARHANFPFAYTETKEKLVNRGIESVRVYHQINQNEYETIEYVEKDIMIDLGDGILVNGQMDLIKRKKLNDDITENVIIDFKSSADAQAYNATIDQLQLYALGYKALTGQDADILEIYNVDDNDKHRNLVTQGDLKNIQDKIKEAADAIRNNQLDQTCGQKGCLCRFKNQD